MNNENLSAVITIEEFPSRAEIITLLKDFIKENNYDPGYSCSNRSNGLTINFQESDVAYAFLKRLNIEKMKNSLYRNTEFSLSFKTKLNHSSSYIMKKGPKYLTSSIHSNSRLNTKKTRTASTGKNDNNSSKSRLNQLTSSYEHLHWKDVTSKAGIINNDSPYLPDEEYVKQQYRENKKRWINKQNFNVFVGKATSNKAYMIKNYVQMTPSIPPVLHSFRPIHKEKWISKKGFMVF